MIYWFLEMGLIGEGAMFDSFEDFLRFCENADDRKKAAEIQDAAAVVCRMILDETVAKVDVDIARENLREKVIQLFPDKIELYRMIYEARFDRLWEQFRPGGKDTTQGGGIE